MADVSPLPRGDGTGRGSIVTAFRRFTIASAVIAAATTGGIVTLSAPASGSQKAANDEPPPLEETFDYPNADQIFHDRGIRLLKGDGRILLVDCGSEPNLLVVESRIKPKPAGDFCFKVKGGAGWLTLNIAESYFLDGDGKNLLTAKIEVDGQTKTVNVAKVGHTPIGEAAGEGPAALVELRVKKG
jgi:hypothetical protein